MRRQARARLRDWKRSARLAAAATALVAAASTAISRMRQRVVCDAVQRHGRYLREWHRAPIGRSPDHRLDSLQDTGSGGVRFNDGRRMGGLPARRPLGDGDPRRGRSHDDSAELPLNGAVRASCRTRSKASAPSDEARQLLELAGLLRTPCLEVISKKGLPSVK